MPEGHRSVFATHFTRQDLHVHQGILTRLYQERFGVPPTTVLPLEGDGSARKLYRVVGASCDTAIGVFGP